MAKMTHCDACKRLIEPGEGMLTMSISEATCAKPGRPRMQYVPGTSTSRPHGLFEVSAELCITCVEKPLLVKELLVNLIGDTPREEFGP
jgi:hypothetical protein